MKIFYSDEHRLHAPRFEVLDGELTPSFETPQRADMVLAAVRAVGLTDVVSPSRGDEAALLRVHRPEYVEFLRTAWDQWVATFGPDRDGLPYCFPVRGMRQLPPAQIEGKLGYYSSDMTAPITPGLWPSLRAGADCALAGAQHLLEGGRSAFALCRPPGHHASADTMGGYCYLNFAAVAAQRLRDAGMARVAILDLDYHHGNGTQSIFYARGDVLFASLHADPDQDYPHYLGYADETGEGEGLGCNLNLPLPLGTDWRGYGPALETALGRIRDYAPQALVVSLGLDTYAEDPISKFRLYGEDYARMGEALAGLALPTLFVFEGGYAVEALGENVASVLGAFAARHR